MTNTTFINIPFKTLCVGHSFTTPNRKSGATSFPRNVLAHTDHFIFRLEPDHEQAQEIIRIDYDLDLVFLDADESGYEHLRDFVAQTHLTRPDLPIVVFGRTLTPDLLTVHADRFIKKQSRQIARLHKDIRENLFQRIDWHTVFEEYLRPEKKPRLEPGLDYANLETIAPEEMYIIKKMFKNSEVVQLFQLDTGLSGSRIYTVKPYREHMRILKIESADGLRTVREKFERLIQPRLDRHIGQLQGDIVEAEHLGGACYMLAGSHREARTLMQFLSSRNQVRREVVDIIFNQLALNLQQLYGGSENVELRFWAPMYARVLPPELTLSDALLLAPGEECDLPTIDQTRLDALAAIPNNPVLSRLRNSKDINTFIALKGFEIAEIDSQNGILYLHDDLTYRRPLSPTFQDKDHPILRFKVKLAEPVKSELINPLFRKGRRIDVKGLVESTQELMLHASIENTLGESVYRLGSKFVEICSEHFVDPLIAARALLWDIGKENIILPMPLISPATHGDLNTNNILLETEDRPQVWLIDFADARYGHIYFDLAKLEVELRTHILYDLFREIVAAGVWDDDTAMRFELLLENVLYLHSHDTFDQFLSALRAHHPTWYDQLYQRFLTYFEHMLYVLYSIRNMARSFGTPDQFHAHYPVAVFFQGLAALKFTNLDRPPFGPWAKRLALLSAMVASNYALKSIGSSSVIDELVSGLKEQSAFAIIRAGRGANRRYLLQWNAHWKMYNLVGGKMDQERDSGLFAKTLQNELWEELGITIGQDYKITHEYAAIFLTQFSRRDLVFKDYEFHIFDVELADTSVIEHASHLFVSPAEIEALRSLTGEPISETALNVLTHIGQIEPSSGPVDQIGLSFRFMQQHAHVIKEQAELRGQLLSWPTSSLVENVRVHLDESPNYTILENPVAYVGRLLPGEHASVIFKVKPNTARATAHIKISFEHPNGSASTLNYANTIEFVTQQVTPFQPIANPYVVGPPVEPAPGSPFFGRSQALNWVKVNLHDGSRPVALSIYGQRRTGKTSLLLHLEHHGRTRSGSNRSVCYVYVDLQKVDAGVEFFLLELAERTQKALRARGLAGSLLPSDDFRHAPYRNFEKFLDAVEESVDNIQLVFLLDEFELLNRHIAAGRDGAGIFNYLRSLLEHRPSIALVMAGTSPERIAPTPEGSMLLAISRSYELTYLDFEQTEQLIREPVKPAMQYEDAAVDAIWEYTHGHPYFTQAICYHLITRYNERKLPGLITHDDVEEAVENILKEGNVHMSNLWDELTIEQQIVLSTLSDRAERENDRPATLREIEEWCRRCIDTASIVDALSALTQAQMIESAPRRLPNAPPEESYRLKMVFMRRWAGRKHPLGTLLRKLESEAHTTPEVKQQP